MVLMSMLWVIKGWGEGKKERREGGNRARSCQLRLAITADACVRESTLVLLFGTCCFTPLSAEEIYCEYGVINSEFRVWLRDRARWDVDVSFCTILWRILLNVLEGPEWSLSHHGIMGHALELLSASSCHGLERGYLVDCHFAFR